LAGRRCDRCDGSVPAAARSDARFCGVLCQQADWYEVNEARLRAAAIAWKASNREAANEAEHRRRARKMGGGSERIDRLAVWERDRGHCWICERRIDAELTFPHPLSPSIDHVIPLNRGGGHVMSNVAMSHLRCNISKQDKILDRVPAWAA
jgi:5-methylcytosine-specific restriction endonuclease McrA